MSHAIAEAAVAQPARRRTHIITSPDQAPGRLDSIDMLRGLAMVVMVLDHVRDFFSNFPYSPSDVQRTTAAMFLTRWVTHFCAPVFVFLAGTGVFLSAAKGKSRPDLTRFLLTRGLWLVFLELTLLRFAMTFSFDYSWVSLTVLWAIGWSMVALAGLIWLPRPAILVVAVAMIGGHNLLDDWKPSTSHLFAGWMPGAMKWVNMGWSILHGPPETFHSERTQMSARIIYPIVPWIGVMAAGYAFGQLLSLERPTRRRETFLQGLALTCIFIIVRGMNSYGDPDPWVRQPSRLFTLFSFLNCEKYPPSLLFLLMTLGPSLMILGLLDHDRPRSAVGRFLIIYGRVPLFFFLLHWAVVHALAVAFAWARGEPLGWLFSVPPFESPEHYGYPLRVVYLVWFSVVLMLYPVCRWFADLKKRRRDWAWLSYF